MNCHTFSQSYVPQFNLARFSKKKFSRVTLKRFQIALETCVPFKRASADSPPPPCVLSSIAQYKILGKIKKTKQFLTTALIDGNKQCHSTKNIL